MVKKVIPTARNYGRRPTGIPRSTPGPTCVLGDSALYYLLPTSLGHKRGKTGYLSSETVDREITEVGRA